MRIEGPVITPRIEIIWKPKKSTASFCLAIRLSVYLCLSWMDYEVDDSIDSVKANLSLNICFHQYM